MTAHRPHRIRPRRLGRAGPVWAALLALASCQAVHPTACILARATALPLRLTNGHLLVDALLNGTPTSLIFDTGSDATVISTRSANRLSVPLLPAGRFEGVGGAGEAFVFVTRSFQIGNLHGNRLHLIASDLGMLGTPSQADGLLGENFLSAYDVDLDLPNQRAVLYAASGACTRPSAALPQPLYVAPMLHRPANDLHPVVQVAIGNQLLSAAVDTGAPYTAIFADAASRLGLDIATLKDDYHFHAYGAGPATPQAVRHVMTAMRIGDITIDPLPVAIIDQPSIRGVDMLLGLDFLTHIHTWLSFSSRTMIMQFSPQ